MIIWNKKKLKKVQNKVNKKNLKIIKTKILQNKIILLLMV